MATLYFIPQTNNLIYSIDNSYINAETLQPYTLASNENPSTFVSIYTFDNTTYTRDAVLVRLDNDWVILVTDEQGRIHPITRSSHLEA
jgi:hypothetical protein